MGGTNPYIDAAEQALPQRPYRITFVAGEDETVVEVDPASLPYTHEGLPGSLLEIALGHGVEIDHACGGVLACSTCHVHVDGGLASCNEASEDEEDMLDNAPGLSDSSRLSCHCVPDGSADVRVVIPGWNRNLAREEH